MPERVKTLAEIMRENPEAVAYNRSLREGMASKQQLAPEPVEECSVCGVAGFVRADLPVDHPRFGEVLPCPNPNCPVLEKQRTERYAKLCTLAQIPAAYEGLSLAGWQELFNTPAERDENEPMVEGEPEYPYRAGKLDAYGAALAFINARDNGFRFTLDDAADAVGLERGEYASPARCSLALSGTFGVGKTSLAVCILRELIDVYQLPAVYLLMDEFFAALHERFEKKDAYEFLPDADDEFDVLRTYQQAPVLVIDEFVLKPGTSDWWEQQVYQLVNYRHNHHMPTIITTNFTSDELTASWGGRVGSRLQTMAHWLLMGGLELRRRDGMRVSR